MPQPAGLTQVQSTELQPTRVSVVGSTTLSGQAGLLQGYASLVGCLCAVASSAALTYITSMSSTTTLVSSADKTRKLQTTSSSIARQLKSSGTTLASKECRSHQFRNSGKCPGLQRYLLNTSTRCCCWNIWNHRHDVVFRHQQPSLRRLLAACKEACRLWGCRLSQRDRHIVDVCCQMFVMH